ncbi:MAG: hypothetical protein COA96_13825 [SAR86 cluster bacterium]|uniref:Beta-lactamase-related domain-containing protein n=1 Tax=SAR86 cluster bacterium TaxID=2030880 RepID=A0A2A5AUS0_9GAMM|nr:MAG: hypothetical protein COA96_13825 [SAR86 cluster bacterium]
MTTLLRITSRFPLSIVLLCLITCPAIAIEPVATDEIDSVFSDWSGIDTPGAVVGIFLDGEILYSEAFGAANLEHSAPINLDTKFNIASMAKTFTAFAVLLLEKQGKLSLDDDIRTYLPEIYAFGEVITIDHLLHHSSGLRNWGTLFALSGVSEDDSVDSADILRLISRQRELNHSPGDRATYSNTNYFLLSLIVERITGQTFREFTTENIFSPLGMSNTFYSDDQNEIVTNRAWGHSIIDGVSFKLDMPQHSDVGSSNLLITMNDFAIWERNLTNPVIGSPELIDKLYSRDEFNNGNTSNYARGTGYGTYRGLMLRGMTGGEPGYRSSRTQFIDSGLSIVIFANATFDVFTPFTQIANLYLSDEFSAAEAVPDTTSGKFVPISSADLIDLAGAYREINSYNVVSVFADSANGIVVISGLGLFYRLKPVGLGNFESVVASDNTRVEFDTTSSKSIRILQNEVPIFSGAELRNIELTPDYNRQFVGTYHSDELDSSFEIELRDDGLYRTKEGMPDRKLDGQFEDLFQAEGGTGTMLFDRNSENKISGFRISVANIFNVLYQKQ